MSEEQFVKRAIKKQIFVNSWYVILVKNGDHGCVTDDKERLYSGYQDSRYIKAAFLILFKTFCALDDPGNPNPQNVPVVLPPGIDEAKVAVVYPLRQERNLPHNDEYMWDEAKVAVCFIRVGHLFLFSKLRTRTAKEKACQTVRSP